jgi:2,4-dienoyl-CoA reductase-like NADH-dependent reductase (Old Yellow Enzyme family)
MCLKKENPIVAHEKFNYKSLEEIKTKVDILGLDIRFDEDLSVLKTPVKVGNRLAPNSFCVLPMEGCDSNLDGSPSNLTARRYLRFARGGSGLVWWEACSILPEAKANERQMMLTSSNRDQFKQLLTNVRNASAERFGHGFRPLHILQLTHSGRYCRPKGHIAQPMIIQHDPILDPRSGIAPDDDSHIVSDDYLRSLVEHYVMSAKLAKQAGFDGVDIKVCHRYLLSELVAARNRTGEYGGSFENRIALIREIVQAVRNEAGTGFIIASRLNAYDAHPYPYGFGCSEHNMWELDLSEPLALAKIMQTDGVDLFCITAGNPYFIQANVTRPFDTSSMGIPIPDEHPLESVQRQFLLAAAIQQAVSVPVVGSGYSWLRNFVPYAASANIKDGRASFVGLGRSSLAYPDAPADILKSGFMKPNKCCITCSKCTQIMRDHGITGCVVRDSETYLPLYKAARADADSREKCFQQERGKL